MTLKINYLDTKKSLSKNTAVFLCRDAKISEFKGIFDDKTNQKLVNYIKKSKNIKENKIDSINLDFDQKILIIFLAYRNDEHGSEKLGAKFYDFIKKNEIENISILGSNFTSIKNKISLNEFVHGAELKAYEFNLYKTKKNKKEININILKSKNNINQKVKSKLDAVLGGVNFTKDLVSEPANILNPISYANRCSKLKIPGLKIKILNLSQIKKIGMNALLAVSQGSVNQPRVVIFEWNLKRNVKPTILVGKGVTFDSGGISLKPSNGMEEMITDMGGSAVVVGSMINTALNKIKKPVVGIIGLVENMPDGNAQRPGDIVKSLSGQTIEVLNTDAEGRLVLGDLITYVQENYKPKEIIDFATLTGAIMVALGTHKAGLFSNNDRLAKKLFDSGKNTSENVWRLPLGEEYDNDINSRRADFLNTGNTRWGGSITAAQFIKRFVTNNNPWAHIDIAGVTWTMKGGKNSISKLHSPGATAFGLRLIDNFLNGK